MKKKICKKFNNWKKDKEAQIWLKIMGYRIEKIDSVRAIHVPNRIKKSEIKKFETTATVAQKLKRKFITMEKSKEYYSIILKRLNGLISEIEQDEEVSLGEQKTLF